MEILNHCLQVKVTWVKTNENNNFLCILAGYVKVWTGQTGPVERKS